MLPVIREPANEVFQCCTVATCRPRTWSGSTTHTCLDLTIAVMRFNKTRSVEASGEVIAEARNCIDLHSELVLLLDRWADEFARDARDYDERDPEFAESCRRMILRARALKADFIDDVRYYRDTL